jgi:hypothetical protein
MPGSLNALVIILNPEIQIVRHRLIHGASPCIGLLVITGGGKLSQ